MLRIWLLVTALISIWALRTDLRFGPLLGLTIYLLIIMGRVGSKYRKAVYAEYANCADSLKNPLYKRGYFKETPSGLFYKSRYKGLYWCQMAAVIILGIIDAIFLMSRINERLINPTLFLVLVVIGGAVGTIGLCYQIYYTVRCELDYSYFENRAGIWQPFSYILHHRGYQWFNRSPLRGVYKIPYESLKEHLENPQNASGYELSGQYDMGDGDEACIFVRKTGACLEIFEIAHIHRFEREHFGRLNKTFAMHWEKRIGKGREVPSARTTFVIMADECYEELEKLIFGRGPRDEVYVRQKKGRNRLPCFVIGNQLKIVLNHNAVLKQHPYNEMLEDLLKLLKIRVRHYSDGRIKILESNFYPNRDADEFYEKTESRRRRRSPARGTGRQTADRRHH